MDWQPIETAPRGEMLLLYQPRTTSRMALPERMIVDSWRGPGYFHRDTTHWMPLPPPPVQPST